MVPLSYLPLVLVVIACIPALVVWWQGRVLVRHAAADDVVLAERMEAAQRRTGRVIVGATILLIALAPGHAIWSLPLMLVLMQAADYPARRQIHGETWTLPAYLSFTNRVTIALSGFWGLLAAAPWLMYFAGSLTLAVGLLLAAVLTIWLLGFERVVRAILRAEPLDRPELERSFEQVIARATVPMPRLWRVDPGGGLVPAAYALPSAGRGGVLFFQPLLDRLPHDEVVAIFAHEVAHLEQWTPRIVRRGLVSGVVLIAFGVLLVPVLHRVAPAWVSLSLILWPIVVLIGLRFRSRSHRPLETAGDRRAAELCGSPDALASALIRLYALTRMPRRIDVDVERWASHPSLARRVQALRALSTAAPVAPAAPVTVVAADGKTAVTFEAEGLRIAPHAAPVEPRGDTVTVGAGERFAYADLHELRLKFAGRSPTLIVRTRTGRVQHVALLEKDAPIVHAVLDRVDVLLAPELPRRSGARPAALVATAASLVALFSPLALLSVFAGSGIGAFAASKATLAAASAAAFAGAGWAVWRGSGTAAAITAALLAVLAVALAGLAWRIPRAQTPVERAMVVVAIAVLAVGTIVGWILGFVPRGTPAWRLHQAAFVSPGIVVFPIALAVLLIARGGSAARVFAIGPAVLALVPLVAATDWFVSRAVRDPLVLPSSRLAEVVGHVEDRRRVAVPEGGSFEVSPGGRWVLRHRYDEGTEIERFYVGSVDGQTLPVEAHEVAFASDGEIAVVVPHEQSVDLIVRRLEPGLPETWRVTLPHVFVMDLSVSPGDRRWRVAGWGPRAEAVRFEGRLGDAHWSERRWPVPGSPEGMWYIGSGPEALWLARPEPVPTWRQIFSIFSAGGHVPEYGVDRVVLVSPGGARTLATALRVNCVAPPVGQQAVACAAFDGRDTRFYRIGKEVSAMGLVRGALWLMDDHVDGTITALAGGDHVLIQPEAGRVVRFARERSPWLEVSYSGTHIAFSSLSTSAAEPTEILEVGRVQRP